MKYCEIAFKQFSFNELHHTLDHTIKATNRKKEMKIKKSSSSFQYEFIYVKLLFHWPTQERKSFEYRKLNINYFLVIQFKSPAGAYFLLSLMVAFFRYFNHFVE